MDSIRPDHLTPASGRPARHPLAWVPTLYLAQGLPFYSVALVAGLMFKSMGVPNEQIARWTGMLGLAWVFKALWSPFLELAASKKRVVVVLQVTGGVALAALALALQLPAWFGLAIGLLGIVSLASSTHDIAADGLYIASLSARQQAAYAGWQGAFFNGAKFLSLGGLVILAGFLEQRVGAPAAWATVFALLGSLLAGLGLYHAWAPDPGWCAILDAGARQAAMDADWNAFANRLGQRELARLDRAPLAYGYRLPPPGAVLQGRTLHANVALPGLALHYTLDGSEPDAASPRYTGPLRAPPQAAAFKVATFDTRGRKSATVVIDLEPHG
jgi:hypothetical protein